MSLDSHTLHGMDFFGDGFGTAIRPLFRRLPSTDGKNLAIRPWINAKDREGRLSDYLPERAGSLMRPALHSPSYVKTRATKALPSFPRSMMPNAPAGSLFVIVVPSWPPKSSSAPISASLRAQPK
ncbi:hypothetical protein KCP77_06460 [Salmonella enterica subsp. enterica]|nr:hypothetical protein KCP77_06460 [Salmonella enterica subsp. enterica]